MKRKRERTILARGVGGALRSRMMLAAPWTQRAAKGASHGKRLLSGAAGERAVIVGAKRTPVGTFMGGLSAVKATELGAVATKAALGHAGVAASDLEEVYFGQVLQANVGQAPARQVALGAGCDLDTPCTTVNKVCASGMKSVMLAANSIRLGDRKIMLAGGMENMSQAPHYMKLRTPTGYGDAKVLDAIQFDGLTDAYESILMGTCTERIIKEMGLTREEQDAFAIRSYERAQDAAAKGYFDAEITPVTVKGRKGDTVVSEDEEPKKFMPDKFPSLRPAFGKDGTITAANASKINDGAAAIIVMSESEAAARGLKPLARILGYDDAAVEPYNFGIANSKASQKVLDKLGLGVSDIDFHEINEAFSAVPILNSRILGIDIDKVNMHGGGVACGHPIGVSGARILMSLINVLQRNDGSLGLASICNGGGGASAMVLERMN